MKAQASCPNKELEKGPDSNKENNAPINVEPQGGEGGGGGVRATHGKLTERAFPWVGILTFKCFPRVGNLTRSV